MGAGTGHTDPSWATADEADPLVAEDSRVLEARRLLEREPISVLSLDLFDTLVWRVVPEPTDAFVLLGQRLIEIGTLQAQVTPPLFGRLRRRAERRARARLSPIGAAEVTLEAVYDELPSHLFGGVGPEKLAALEVDFERDITFPDLEVTRLARTAQEQAGRRVVIVSDTYYSEAQIRGILNRPPFTDLDLHRVFTSSDHGVGKGSGLYQVVLEALDVEPRQVLHVGDKEIADVECAGAAGIHTVFFDTYPHSLRTVLEREGVIGALESERASVNPVGGDLGLTAIRSRVASRTRPAGLGGGGLGRASLGGAGESPYWRFGATVLGPVFTGFAEWAHRRAQAEGVATVHCIMREGEFLSRLLNGARRYLGSDVVARPLWLSRDVCARAAILEASTEELAIFLHRRRPPTLRALCFTLGIELDQLPELFNHAEGRLDDPELRRRTFEAIAGHPDVRAAIVLRSSVLRSRLVDYFVRTVGPESRRVVLADLGWGGTIQAYLDRALADAGLEVDTLGLYLLTNDAGAERMLDGVRLEGFLGNGGLPEDAIRWIIRSPEIVEQVCMVDEGSLVDFDADANPVQGPKRESPAQALQRTAVQSGVLAFQSEWARYAAIVPLRHRGLDQAREMLLDALFGFVVSPTVEEATLFAPWLHDEDYGSTTSERVIHGDIGRSLRYMTPRQFLELPMSRLYWPFGLAALTEPSLAVAAAAVAQGELPAEAFESDEPIAVEILVDVGAGFVAGRTAEAHVNGNGLCFVREEVSASPIRAVQIRFPATPGVVRIDAVRLWFSGRGQPEPTAVEISWPEQFRQLRVGDGSQLSGNLLHGPQRGPHVTYRVPPEAGDDVYRLAVEMGFAWLPTSPAPRGRPPASEAVRRLTRRAGRRLVTALIEGGGSVVAPDGSLTPERLRSMWRAAERMAGQLDRPPRRQP